MTSALPSVIMFFYFDPYRLYFVFLFQILTGENFLLAVKERGKRREMGARDGGEAEDRGFYSTFKISSKFNDNVLK